MADVKISQLLLFTPELTDTLIVNDVSEITTKRSTIQSIRDLANENIDDTLTGSEVTGTLNVTQGITGEDFTFSNTLTDGFGNSITNLNDLLQNADNAKNIDATDNQSLTDGYLIFREDPEGFDSSYTNSGLRFDTTGVLATLTSPAFSGDGENITNIQYSEAAGIADLAIRAYRADSAGYADSAGVAKYADSAGITKQIRVITETNPGERYLTFTEFTSGVDSVRTDPDLSYDQSTGELSSQFFVGDGSLLTNITAAVSTATQSEEIDAKLNSQNLNQYVMFRTLSAGYDSTYTDQNLLYNPSVNLLSGGANVSDLSLFGVAEGAKKTFSNDISVDGTYYITMKASGTSLDSVNTSTGITYASATETLSASFFSGNGASITNVDAITSSQADTVAVSSATDDNNYFVSFVDAVTGNLGVNVNGAIRVKPNVPALQMVSNTGRMTFGVDSDLKVYHDGANAYIDTLTGGLRIQNSTVPAVDTVIVLDGIPTSDPVNAGQLWNDAGTLKISAG